MPLTEIKGGHRGFDSFIKNGAYIELFDISPSIITDQIPHPLMWHYFPRRAYWENPSNKLRGGLRRMQADVIKVHLARTACLQLALVTDTNGNRTDVG